MQRLFNDQWEFSKTPNGALPAEDSFSPVALPHDWLISNTNNLYENSDGWYRRVLHISCAKDGKRRILRFDGVYMDCDVLVNGTFVCNHRYGYTAFDADLTDALTDGENVILVHVRHTAPNSRWYSGAGIYRDVTYMELPSCCISPDGIYEWTERTESGWMMHIETEIIGSPCEEKPLHRLIDRSGECICEGSGDLFMKNPHLWSCSDPYCYRLDTHFASEILSQTVGFREIRMDPDSGLFVNGESIKLHGVCLHHDLGALGAAFHEKAARRQLSVMKSMGVNAIRTAHNPPARQVMDLCDEMGILVVSEAFDMWEKPKTPYDYARFFPDSAESDVRSWVRRDRNHPSLLMWSIGNEIVDTHLSERGQKLTRMLMGFVREHDPRGNGALTIGLNYLPWENAQKCVDLLKNGGYNYAEKLYAAHHENYPDWVIYGSETGSLVSSRGVYHFPIDAPILSDADLQCSSLGNSLTSWGTKDVRKMITDDLNTPYSMGQFIWSGIDYIGEPTPYHTRSSYFGLADTACFPKDLYHFVRAAWKNEPVLHIGVHWDFNPGQLIDVNVMTNAYEAELMLNGRSLGRKRISFSSPETALPCWRVPFEPGELKARAYDKNGLCLGETARQTPGDSRRLHLTTEDTHLYADAHDMTFITVTALDEQGHPVENACDRVQIELEGPGVLLGTDNGDSTDPDGYKASSRRLFSGKLLAMIGSLDTPGELIVRASAPGLGHAVLRIPVLPAAVQPGRVRLFEALPGRTEEPVHARKIELTPLGKTNLTPDCREVSFAWKLLPGNAMPQDVSWQLTNAMGIETNRAALSVHEDMVTVRALGDGTVYLRALCNNGYRHPRLISPIEILIDGLGTPNLDPYSFIAGGLYDISSGEISPGNERGLAFSRDGRSMAGFTNVDFGPDGSDEMTLPVFALDGDRYEIEMYLGNPDEGAPLFALLPYQKPSRWNVYQSETYRLPCRITGVQTVCFAMNRKIHLKGFSFTRQSRAFLPLFAADADFIYGDQFTREGKSVTGIGNNVSLVFERMDFGKHTSARIALEGSTPLPRCPVTVAVVKQDGTETSRVIEFDGFGGTRQFFPLSTPGGLCRLTFIFLPGSQFDFHRFRIEPADTNQNP